MKRGEWVAFGLATVLGASACGAIARPVAAPAAAPESDVLGLGHPPDRRFAYAVQPDGVYAIAHAVDAQGRPVFSRKRIKVASIQPALAPDDTRVVDRDGDLVPPRGRTVPRTDIRRKLIVLVKDPADAAQLDAAPRSKDEFLALDDRTLVDYASAWLRYRGIDRGDASALTGPERDVMLASLAFTLVADDGFSGLLAMREGDLPAMRDCLRRMALDRFAELIDRANQLAHDGQQEQSTSLDDAWHHLGDDPVPRLAAYIRAHADEIDWSQMHR